MLKRIYRLVKVELFKLLRQRIFYIATGLTVLAVAGTILADKYTPTDNPLNGFTVLSKATINGFAIAALFILIFGSLSLSSETTAGVLKMVLIAPYRRSELFFAKAITIKLIALILTALIELIGLALVWYLYGFGDIVDPTFKDYVHLSGAEAFRYTVYTFIIVLLPLVAIGFFGLFLSTLIESAGIAVAIATLFYLFLGYLVVTLFSQPSSFLFNYYLDWYLITLRDISTGVLGEIWRFRVLDEWLGLETAKGQTLDYAGVVKSLLVPVVWATLFSVTGLVVFKRKDVI
ncbi:MAG: ABC transporter permease subunit [Planctomycetes bacterium]|nr:ABC transporter permease subunit [Planctomycetota bacterium]